MDLFFAHTSIRDLRGSINPAWSSQAGLEAGRVDLLLRAGRRGRLSAGEPRTGAHEVVRAAQEQLAVLARLVHLATLALFRADNLTLRVVARGAVVGCWGTGNNAI